MNFKFDYDHNHKYTDREIASFSYILSLLPTMSTMLKNGTVKMDHLNEISSLIPVTIQRYDCSFIAKQLKRDLMTRPELQHLNLKIMTSDDNLCTCFHVHLPENLSISKISCAVPIDGINGYNISMGRTLSYGSASCETMDFVGNQLIDDSVCKFKNPLKLIDFLCIRIPQLYATSKLAPFQPKLAPPHTTSNNKVSVSPIASVSDDMVKKSMTFAEIVKATIPKTQKAVYVEVSAQPKTFDLATSNFPALR